METNETLPTPFVSNIQKVQCVNFSFMITLLKGEDTVTYSSKVPSDRPFSHIPSKWSFYPIPDKEKNDLQAVIQFKIAVTCPAVEIK